MQECPGSTIVKRGWSNFPLVRGCSDGFRIFISNSHGSVTLTLTPMKCLRGSIIYFCMGACISTKTLQVWILAVQKDYDSSVYIYGYSKQKVTCSSLSCYLPMMHDHAIMAHTFVTKKVPGIILNHIERIQNAV